MFVSLLVTSIFISIHDSDFFFFSFQSLYPNTRCFQPRAGITHCPSMSPFYREHRLPKRMAASEITPSHSLTTEKCLQESPGTLPAPTPGNTSHRALCLPITGSLGLHILEGTALSTQWVLTEIFSSTLAYSGIRHSLCMFYLNLGFSLDGRHLGLLALCPEGLWWRLFGSLYSLFTRCL